MKRIVFGILLVLFVSSWALAESSVWKARKGDTVIYLGGTCHVLRPSDYPLPAEFETAYRASDVVVFETDIAKLQDPSMQQLLMSRAMYADGSTLENHLSPKALKELQAYCEANGLPLAAFNRLKPSMLMVTLTVMELMKLGVSQQGVDRFFYDQALKDKKRIDQLETVEEQIGYLVSMSDGNEDQFVRHSIRDMKSLDEKFELLAGAWRKGDTNELDRLMFGELKAQQPKLYKKLITSRNSRWLQSISRYDKKGGTRFVLVGVGHLVGPDGLVASLRKKGFQVEKL